MMGPSFGSLLLGFAWMLFVFGGMLAWVGWRGRRVNDHPICRKCGFDLVGHAARLSPPVAADARCPECGKNLGSAESIRIGQRVRRPRLLWLGLLLLLAGGLGVGAWTVAGVTATNWNTYKPTRLLVLEAENPSRTGVQGVYAELVARHAANPTDFSSERSARLVAAVLKIQADRSALWYSEMGQMVEVLRVGGLVDDANWQTYARQAMAAVGVEAADEIEEGDALIVRATFAGGRASKLSSLSGLNQLASVAVGTTMLDGGAGSSGSLGIDGTSASQTGYSFELPPGRYEAVVKMTRSVFDAGAAQPASPVVDKDPVDFKVPFTVVAKGRGARSLQADPTKLEAISSAISLERLTLASISPESSHVPGSPSSLEFYVKVKNAPVDLAMELLLEIPASADKPARLERVLGFTARAGSGQYTTGGGIQLPADFPLALLAGEKSTLKFVIRGSMQTLKSTVDMQRAWGGSFERSAESTVRRTSP